MYSHAAIRFVGVLPSEGAEAVARRCIAALQRVYPDVDRWDLCVRPPLAQWDSGGYSVRVQTRLNGSVISTSSQAIDLREAVRDALEGIEELLLQEHGQPAASAPAWLPTRAGALPSVAP